MKNHAMKNQKGHARNAWRRTMKTTCLTCLLAAMMAANGCKTYRSITGPASPQLTNDLMARSIKSGDTVKIITKDGQELKFKVQQVGSETISGENQSVSFQEIARIEKRKISAGKTTVLILGVLGIVILGLGIAAAATAGPVMAGG
jgi:hypothetical protein